MRTNLGVLTDGLKALRSEAVRLSGRDHEAGDLKSLLKDAGGTVETFLKAYVYPAGSKSTFEKLIDGLAPLGIAPSDLAALHVLRRRYNAAKHDPQYIPTIDEVIEALGGAASV